MGVARLFVSVGQRFGRWSVVGETVRDGKGGRVVPCRCDCGTVRPVVISTLLSGKSVSCGCWKRARSAERCRSLARHGHSAGGKVSPEYLSWTEMKRRCLDPTDAAYPRYGGQGMTIAPRWLGPHGFSNFLADMGPRPAPGHTLDRIKNGKRVEAYGPENCRWADKKTQARNTTKNRILVVDGEARCLAEWAEIGERSGATITYRLAAGLSPTEAVRGPLRRGKRLAPAERLTKPVRG